MRGEQTKTIDGRFYRTRAFPMMAALEFQRRLVRLLSEPVFLLFAAGGTKERKEALGNPGVRAEIIYCVNTRAQPGDLEVLRELLELTWCSKIQLGDQTVEGNVQEHFDEHFRGDTEHLVNVVTWVIEVNFQGPTQGSRSTSGSGTPTPEPTAE